MARKLTAVADRAEHEPAADETNTTTSTDEPRAADDEVTPDDEHAEQRGAWPTGVDVEAIAAAIDALRAATNEDTVSIFLRTEGRRFDERFSFEGLDVQPSGVRSKFMAEAARKFDDQRRGEARALKATIAEARRALTAAAEAATRLPLESERVTGAANEQVRLLARICDNLELQRAEREVAEMSTALLRRRFEQTRDSDDRWFVITVERAVDQGRLRPDDATELQRLVRAIRARQSGRVPTKIRDGIARLDELTSRPTFGAWLSHVAKVGAGAAHEA